MQRPFDGPLVRYVLIQMVKGDGSQRPGLFWQALRRFVDYDVEIGRQSVADFRPTLFYSSELRRVGTFDWRKIAE